ncbi:MAG TPA: PaaI family thioesterase [Acidimicrobiales bacterium]|nr:PaaI family thioesterase [Acidimicrobiales bacterium]
MLYYSGPELEAVFDARGEQSGAGALGGTKPTGERTPHMTVLALDEQRLVVLRRADERDLRPGALWSGPALVTLVDAVGFMITVAHLPPGSDALTTDLSVQFLRGAPFGDLTAEAEVLRMGRRTAVFSVNVRSEQVTEGPVCHATITFAARPAPTSD